MSKEGQLIDRKSIRALDDISELSKDCVAFANARGGCLEIGIEDDAYVPPPSQRISDDMVERLRKRIPQNTVNVGIDARKVIAVNGGEYIELQVFASKQTIAATTEGRYYYRVADECRPLMPDDLIRLSGEKSAFSWESHQGKRVSVEQADRKKQRTFLESIRNSRRVSTFVQDKTDTEILDYYQFSIDGNLTNLGILWIGRREERRVLRYAPAIQCIKYDEAERKINKWIWDDYDLNPLELIEAVWKEIPDWRQSYEFPDGLFRTTVPHYDEVVVRELLANALVHRPYTQAGDLFINLFPDRMEVHNPGLLPLGVTPRNILHTTVKRNDCLAKVFYDLGLMEREGSGFDKIYEVLLSTGRPVPIVSERHDGVAVTVYKKVVSPAVLDFLGKADQMFDMSQKEKIVLGLLAQYESLNAMELCRILELDRADELQPWLGKLPKWGLTTTRGRTKGLQYRVDSEVLRKLEFRGATTLKGIEAHRLRELIVQDLGKFKEASMAELRERIGSEVPVHQVRQELRGLIREGRIAQEGKNRWARYRWTEGTGELPKTINKV